MNQEIYEKLLSNQLEILNQVSDKLRRTVLDHIEWQDKLIILAGARGVGKTTIMLQRLNEIMDGGIKVLYISMDDITVSNLTLIEIAKYHLDNGGSHILIDEIHKYNNWSQELKNIYDRYKSLFVVVTGSSILEINEGQADLSRRAVKYSISGFSLREFINIESKQNFQPYSLSEIIENHEQICRQINKLINPLPFFNEYNQYGYYPFYLEGKRSYFRKLNSAINHMIEVDLVQITKMDVSKLPKIKKLLYWLASTSPYEPNISKLSSALELDRNTVIHYLSYLDKAELTKSVWSATRTVGHLSKPDKIYLQNANLFFLSASKPDIGTIRECFFVHCISHEHNVSIPNKGDFFVDEKYTFEIGGKSKGYKQISSIPGSFIVSDDINYSVGNKIPLWLFGFLK
ncbi:MAG: ATP-binding protein [Saprospiraceae bacterium]|nr:ATP-binding protein [Saprospiraceae bacterium]